MAEAKTKLAYHDRLSPLQHEQSKLFRGTEIELVEALHQTIVRAGQLRSPHDELELDLTPLHAIEEMASAPLNLRLLQFLVGLSGAKRVLEIGAFIGVSAIYMARALPPGGSLTTIEKFDHFAKICRNNIDRNQVAEKVRVVEGDAMQVLDSLRSEEPFDLILIDGDKGRYHEYFQKADELLRAGGLIVVDDAFFHGDVLNAHPQTEKGAGVKEMLHLVASRSDFRILPLPIANGVLLAHKLQH